MRILPAFLFLLVALSLVLAIWLLGPLWTITGHLSSGISREPSRLYGRVTRVAVGDRMSSKELVSRLEAQGYRSASPGAKPAPGLFTVSGRVLSVYLRSFPSPEGWTPPRRLGALFQGARIAGLEIDGSRVQEATLPPSLLASYYGPGRRDRRPVRVENVPRHLVLAVLAAEDAGFFDHPGLSASAILRAAWVNFRSKDIQQGGSTLTQQLVKNLFLSHDRTWRRKAQEVALALLVDLRYEKNQILQAYLNEIYLGASSGVSLVGVGAASWAYFGKEPSELNLSEAATLAGIIPAPATYSPLKEGNGARNRRDLVLRRLEALGWIDEATVQATLAEPLEVRPQSPGMGTTPWFAAHAAREARAHHDVEDLEDGGFTLLSTLDPSDQELAEEAVAWGLDRLESRTSKDGSPIQAALVAVDPKSGAIRAYVGGRDFRTRPFDRVGSAHRQAGSAFKPVVYAAAFQKGTALPSTLLNDSTLTLKVGARRWTPRNSDGKHRGWVASRTALEQSLNVPTVRLALDVGMENVARTARQMGVEGPLSPFPSLALGAAEVTPLELVSIYATLAAGGTRPRVHALNAVLDSTGLRTLPAKLPPRERPISAETAFMVTSILQGVLQKGTGRSARALGLEDRLAGKTGTTNDRRDCWFAGYASSHAAAVWVGHDDNSPTGLSGAQAALPIWVRYVQLRRPPGGYPEFVPPRGIRTATIDPLSGLLATDGCPTVQVEAFPVHRVPTEACHLHQSLWQRLRRRF